MFVGRSAGLQQGPTGLDYIVRLRAALPADKAASNVLLSFGLPAWASSVSASLRPSSRAPPWLLAPVCARERTAISYDATALVRPLQPPNAHAAALAR